MRRNKAAADYPISASKPDGPGRRSNLHGKKPIERNAKCNVT